MSNRAIVRFGQGALSRSFSTKIQRTPEEIKAGLENVQKLKKFHQDSGKHLPELNI